MAEEKKITFGKIGNALKSVATDHIVAVAGDVFDEERQKYQSEVNTNLESKIEEEAEARELSINTEAQARTQNDQLLSQAIAAEQERAKEMEQNISNLNIRLDYFSTLESKDITFVEGYYINYLGQKIEHNTYKYTSPIFLKKGEYVMINTNAVSDVVAVVSETDSSGNFLQALVIADETVEKKYFYQADKDVYIVCSLYKSNNTSLSVFSSKEGSHIVDLVNSIKEETDEKINLAKGDIEKNQTSIENIDAVLNAKEVLISDDDIIYGSYRTINGSLAENSTYFYTKAILLYKNEEVIIDNLNSSSNISVISEVDNNNQFIRKLYVGEDVAASYTYMAPKDMYISLSALNSGLPSIFIKTVGLRKRVEVNKNDIMSIKNEIFSKEILLNNIDLVTGGYRTALGVLATLSGYFYSSPIKMYSGEKITTISAVNISQNVAIISKVDSDNNFISLLKAGSSTDEVIEYILEEDCYVSISALYKYKNDFVLTFEGGIRRDTREELNVKIDKLLSSLPSLLYSPDTLLPAIDSNPLSVIRRDTGYGAIIRKWGIIGDSLSSGEMQCYDDTSTSTSDYKFIDMYQYSWGQFFARLIGADAYNFSNGGQTTWGWLKGQGFVHDDSYIGGIGGGDWELAKQDAYKKDAYIIALGVNDRRKIEKGEYELGVTSQIVSYDGTNSDIDDTSVNPKSFVRYYAGIIQRVKSIQPKAKIFCVTPIGSNYAEIAQAIRDIVEYYSSDDVYLIDLFNYIPTGYNVDGYMLNGHLSPMGYTYTAYMMNTYIDWIIRNNGNRFKDTALIGTDYRANW